MTTQIDINLIKGIIVGILAIAGLLTVAIVAIKQTKKKRIVHGVITPTNQVITSGDKIIDYHLTDQFLLNKPNLFIKYYSDFKKMQYHGRIDELGVLLSDLDSVNYKFYLNQEVYPTDLDGIVKGFIDHDIFYITGTVD